MTDEKKEDLDILSVPGSDNVEGDDDQISGVSIVEADGQPFENDSPDSESQVGQHAFQCVEVSTDQGESWHSFRLRVSKGRRGYSVYGASGLRFELERTKPIGHHPKLVFLVRFRTGRNVDPRNAGKLEGDMYRGRIRWDRGANKGLVATLTN